MCFKQYARCLGFIVISLFLATCGEEEPTSKQEGDTKTPAQKAFYESAQKQKIPFKLLQAAAYLESKINPKKSFTLVGDTVIGLENAETAFGLSYKTLGLLEHETPQDLSLQIEVYSAWLAKKLKGVILPKSPTSSDEIFSWLWEMAQHHRTSRPGRRNLRILFVKEMISILNDGYSWQDPDVGKVIFVPPLLQPIVISELRDVSQKLLRYSMRRSQIESAELFPLVNPAEKQESQKPNGILVTHCSFELSACLEAQHTKKAGSPSYFKAHYMIPPSSDIVDIPLQLNLHERAFSLLAEKGQAAHSNKVIISLVGSSGRVINGTRESANPTWFTKWQLQRLGELVADVCNHIVFANLSSEDTTTEIKKCMKIDSGVFFQKAITQRKWLWGDVPDYDPYIFNSYIKNPEGLLGSTSFDFSNQETFKAGESLNFNLDFQERAQNLELEQLVRCKSGRVAWNPIAFESVRSQTTYGFSRHIWDAGPNQNGSHFFRAKVYDHAGELLGWDMKSLILQDYEITNSSNLIAKACKNDID